MREYLEDSTEKRLLYLSLCFPLSTAVVVQIQQEVLGNALTWWKQAGLSSQWRQSEHCRRRHLLQLKTALFLLLESHPYFRARAATFRHSLRDVMGGLIDSTWLHVVAGEAARVGSASVGTLELRRRGYKR